MTTDTPTIEDFLKRLPQGFGFGGIALSSIAAEHDFIRRLLVAVPTLIVISAVCYLVISAPAGDVIQDYEMRLVQIQSYSIEAAHQAGDQLRVQYGLADSLPERYLIWLGRFVRGDFGISLVSMHSVADIVVPRLGMTLLISLLSLALSWLVGVTLGIFASIYRGTFAETALAVLGLVTLSVPPFLIGLGLLVVVVVVFHASPPIGLFSAAFRDAPWSLARVLDLLWHLWIPVLVAGLSGAASIMRIMRTNLLDEIRKPYVDTARAKGLPERKVIMRHAARLAINPLIALLGLEFPLVISNGIIISIVVGLPTIGPVLQDALVSRDIYVAAAILMLLGVLLILGNLVADMLLAWVDPRVRYR